ncbi:hypothetical protein JCM14469_13840 [Desulfatiferula olefinivorans]
MNTTAMNRSGRIDRRSQTESRRPIMPGPVWVDRFSPSVAQYVNDLEAQIREVAGEKGTPPAD